MSSEQENENSMPRKRSITSITLGWLAEKLRRSEKIKEEVSAGTYSVNSEKIAEAILNKN